MSNVTIFSERKFAFGPGLQKNSGANKKFIAQPKVFMQMPEEFTKDELFKDCVRLGLVRVVGSKKDERAVEDNRGEVYEEEDSEVYDNSEDDDEEGTEEEENSIKTLYERIKAIPPNELKKAAEEKGIALKGTEKAKEIRKLLLAAAKKEEAND